MQAFSMAPGGAARRRLAFAFGALILASGLLLGACSAGGGGSTAATGQKVQVAMTDSSLAATPASVAAGDVTFAITSTGTGTHEFVVLKTDLAPTALKKLASDPTRVDEDASGQNVGEIEDLQTGQTKQLNLNLKPGKYVLLCNVAGHYDNGMRTGFEVK
jgi:uncharacterized cupredoxin-like copper-binding protein